MSFARPTALQMAFHEAGHACCFACLASGDLPVELGLEAIAGGFRGWSKRLKMAETEAADLVSRDLGDEGGHRWSAAAEASIALAGPLAEARKREGSSAAGLLSLHFTLPHLLDPASPAIDDDFRRIRQMLPMIAPEVGTVDAARALLIRTNDILDHCWPGLQRLARRLLAERHLMAKSLRQHFEMWPVREPLEEPNFMLGTDGAGKAVGGADHV